MAIKTRETTGTGVTNKGAPLTNAELDNNFIELVAEDAAKLENVVEDTTPQLGGDLDVNDNNINLADAYDGNTANAFVSDGTDTINLGSGATKIFHNTVSSYEIFSIHTLPTAAGSYGWMEIDSKSQIDFKINSTTVLNINSGSLNLGSGTDIQMSGGGRLQLSGGNDYNLFYDSTNYLAYIDCTVGDLIIRNTRNDKDITIQSDNGSGGVADYFLADGSTGEVVLYHYGSAKLTTKSTGVQTTGTLNVNGAYTLPTSDGTSGQVLTTDGSGALSFTTVSGSGGISNVVEDTTPQLGGNLDLNGKRIEGTGYIRIDGDISTINGTYGNLTWSQSGGILHVGDDSWIAMGNTVGLPTVVLVANSPNGGGNPLQIQDNNYATPKLALAIDPAAEQQIFYNGAKKFETTSAGVQTTGTVNVNGAYTLPTSDGTSGQVLTTNGAGAVTFQTVSGGGGGGVGEGKALVFANLFG
jgi:hypothetical protein